MTRHEARAIAVKVAARSGIGDTVKLDDAARIEEWLLRPAPGEEYSRDKGPVFIGSGAGAGDPLSIRGYGEQVKRTGLGAFGAPPDAPDPIRTESMRKARDIIGNLFVDGLIRGSPLVRSTLSTEETDKAIMAILRAINE